MSIKARSKNRRSRSKQRLKTDALSFIMAAFKNILNSVVCSIFGPDFILKPEQVDCIRAICLEKKDVFAQLPTGFGKSVIYQVIPKLSSNLSLEKNKRKHVIVVSPLLQIMKEQIKELRACDVLAGRIEESEEEDKSIETGNIEVIFGNAEQWRAKRWKRFLEKNKENITAFVVDEVHTVATWGFNQKKGKKKKIEAFRKAFGELGQLRAFLPNTPLVALTATADKKMRNIIEKSLSMQTPLRVLISPNKENIRISAMKVNSLAPFNWLINLLEREKQGTPFTIIFCNTITDIAHLLSFFLMKLGKNAYVENEQHSPLAQQCLLGVFHSAVFQQMKDTINTSFKDLQGSTRVVFATSALSMGVNYPEIKYVIHYGPSRGIVSHLQEAGRAGRNGQQAYNIIYFEGKHLRHCDEHIRNAMKSSSCLRKLMYKFFDESIQSLQPFHLCCSNCQNICDCGDCPTYEFEAQPTENIPDRSRAVVAADKADFKAALSELQSSLVNPGFTLFDSSDTMSHGFSQQLIQSLADNLQYIFDVQYLLSEFSFSCIEHAVSVLEVVQEMFSDIEDFDSIIAHARMNDMNKTISTSVQTDTLMLDYFESDCSSSGEML